MVWSVPQKYHKGLKQALHWRAGRKDKYWKCICSQTLTLTHRCECEVGATTLESDDNANGAITIKI